MPDVKKFIKQVQDYASWNKAVSSMFGRIRRLPNVAASDKWMRLEALRQSVNMPIQSTAADYTLVAMMTIMAMFEKYHMKSRVIATVHDNIVVDRYRKEARIVHEIMDTVMREPQHKLIYWSCCVPILADFESGISWGELESE